MVAETLTCTGCNGKGTVRALVNRQGGCVEVDAVCSTCDGVGWLSREHIERIAAGLEMRIERLNANETLRERAAKLGITVVELSKRERGKL